MAEKKAKPGPIVPALKVTKKQGFFRSNTKTENANGIRWARIELANDTLEQSVAFEKLISAIESPQTKGGKALTAFFKSL